MATETTRQQPSGLSTFVWALFFFFAFTLLVVLGIRWAGKRENYEDARVGVRLEKRAERDKADAEQLNSPGWVDEGKGVLRIPIAEAKKLVLANLRAKKPAPSSVPLDPRLPMPVIDPAAKEPPPPALPSAPQGADTMYFPNLAKETPPAPAAIPAAPAAVPAAPSDSTKPEAAPASPDRPPLIDSPENPKPETK
ncbi:MAG: hypothetical protein ABI680_15545 [Chthoniobacteraceae bacterium]